MILRLWKKRDTAAAVRRPRFRRAVGLAVAGAVAAVSASVAVQAGARPAQAAVDPQPPAAHQINYALAAVLGYWLNQHWPLGNRGNNAVFHPRVLGANGYVNGGGAYQDRSRNLTNYIHQVAPQSRTVQLQFREYDASTRPSASTGRNAERFIYNTNYNLYFYTWNHYTDFVPLNFGSLASPWFPQLVLCYQYTNHGNPTRVRLWNGTSGQTARGEGFSVSYFRATEHWNGSFYSRNDSVLPDPHIGFSFYPYRAIQIHNNADAICQQWAGLPHGVIGRPGID